MWGFGKHPRIRSIWLGVILVALVCTGAARGFSSSLPGAAGRASTGVTTRRTPRTRRPFSGQVSTRSCVQLGAKPSSLLDIFQSNGTLVGQRLSFERGRQQQGGEAESKPKNMRRRRKLLSLAVAMLLAGSLCRPAIAATKAASSITGSPPLGFRHLASAAAVLAVSAGFGLSQFWNLSSLSRAMAKAAARCTLQLYLVSGFLLTHMFSVAKTRPALVLLWIIATGALAAREAVVRVEYTYPDMNWHMLVSVWTGGLSVMGLMAVFRMLGPIQPWFSPRAWIPVAGMLFGNTLSAAALAAGTVTRELAVQKDQVELKLCRGATWREALQSVVQTTLTTALTPTMTMLSVSGIVHVPGMMTGQILAGQAPFQAAAYQVLIFLLIASQACVTVQTLLRLIVHALVDQPNDRMRTQQLTRVQNGVPLQKQGVREKLSVLLSWWYQGRNAGVAPEVEAGPNGTNDRLPPGQSVRLEGSVSQESAVLRVNNMKVAQTNVDLSLVLYPGDRVGIQGPSGIGKSQILRTLTGLETLDRSSVTLMGSAATNVPMPEWRRRITLVPQNRPSVDGTPQEFFDEVSRYQTVPHKDSGQSPFTIAEEWGLSRETFNQPWATLSGGESQRASLAIALALEPDVLLLDESTSGLDEETTLRVENTLKRTGIPVVLVSHSSVQVNRFCNRRIDLGCNAIQSTLES